MAEMQNNPEQLSKNRRVIVGIFAIPLLVFALSTGLYYLVQWKAVELGTVNNGELVIPPLPFADLPLATMDGSAFDYSMPERKWAFVVFGDSDCEGDCERMLYIARQSIVALAKKMDRVRLVYFSQPGAISDTLHHRFEQEYRGLDVITAPPRKLQALFADAVPSADQPRSLFVVDPHGWLMMSYQVGDTHQQTLNTLGKAVVHDMKRLIK